MATLWLVQGLHRVPGVPPLTGAWLPWPCLC